MDIDEAAKIATSACLPEKSGNRYEFAYRGFKIWCAAKKVETISENVMLAYMLERSNSLKSPSSLWCEYSMLKTTINIKDNVDISKFYKLLGFLKSKNKGYRPKKSQILNREEIVKFFQEADDDTYLLIKTVMIMGIAGACRADEFCKMQMTDVTDHGNYVIIKIPQSKNDVQRSFSIVENIEENIDYLGTFKKYFEIRKKIKDNPRFFLRYQAGKCMNQPVGKHTFGKMPTVIAKFLNLADPHLYTGHCFRRSSATLLANAGADILSLKRHGGWKSGTVAESYVAESEKNKIDIANKILYNKTINTASTSKEQPLVTQIDSNLLSTSPQQIPQNGTVSFTKEQNNVLEKENLVLKNCTFTNSTVIFNINNK